jgi:hypothetical protein
MLLPQLQAELVAAAQRPVLAKRLSVRAAAILVAAVLALLIAAPPTVARLQTSVGAAAIQGSH